MTKNNNMKLKKPKKPKIPNIPKIIKIEQKELLSYKGRFKSN